MESDADEELLFNIPFTGNVKLKGIIIASEDSDSHPAKLRLLVNFFYFREIITKAISSYYL